MIFIPKEVSDLMKDGERVEDFMNWAFTDDWERLAYHRLFQRWNREHSSLLILFEDGVMSDHFPEMIKLWRLSKAK